MDARLKGAAVPIAKLYTELMLNLLYSCEQDICLYL